MRISPRKTPGVTPVARFAKRPTASFNHFQSCHILLWTTDRTTPCNLLQRARVAFNAVPGNSAWVGARHPSHKVIFWCCALGLTWPRSLLRTSLFLLLLVLPPACFAGGFGMVWSSRWRGLQVFQRDAQVGPAVVKPLGVAVRGRAGGLAREAWPCGAARALVRALHLRRQSRLFPLSQVRVACFNA